MNLSGGPVQKAVRAYGLGPDQVVCVHDDVEATFGQVRAKLGGGLGGHNGLRSVAERLGTRDFGRVRCGIGRQRPGDRRDLADWVLSPFEPDEDPQPMVGARRRLRRADRARGHRGGDSPRTPEARALRCSVASAAYSSRAARSPSARLSRR